MHRWSAPLSDLQPGVTDPLDSARGRLLMVSHHGATTVVFLLSGVGADAAGRTYGAHLHTGPCVAGNGAAAGPHYNDSTVHGVVPPVVGPRTEVWLDVTIRGDGSAVAVAHVPFVPQSGQRSVVVHAQPTDDHGTAGPRLACLPVSWSTRRALAGAGLGLMLGVAARIWMRLVATEPELTWAGTGFVLGAFAVAGLGVGVAAAARVQRRSRWTRLALLLAVPVFLSPGMVLAPALVVGGWGLRRGPKARLAAAAAVLLGPVMLVATTGGTSSRRSCPTPTLSTAGCWPWGLPCSQERWPGADPLPSGRGRPGAKTARPPVGNGPPSVLRVYGVTQVTSSASAHG